MAMGRNHLPLTQPTDTILCPVLSHGDEQKQLPLTQPTDTRLCSVLSHGDEQKQLPLTQLSQGLYRGSERHTGQF